jgi:hypothetical protein
MNTAITAVSAVFTLATTFGAGGLAADDTADSSCSVDGVTLDYTVDFDAGAGDYLDGSGDTSTSPTDNSGMVFEVTHVVVGGIADDCVDQVIDVSLANGAGKQVETLRAVIAQTGVEGQDANTITLMVDGDGEMSSSNLLDGINAAEVLHAAVVIQTA